MNQSPFRLIWGGYAAVSIFFVMSGYFLYSGVFICDLQGYCKSVIRRIARIYPLYALVTCLGIVLCFTVPLPENMDFTPYLGAFWSQILPISDYLRQFLLIGALDPRLVNPPIWTLMNEARFAFLAPFFASIVKKADHKGNAVLMAVIIICSFFFSFGHIIFAFLTGMEIRKYSQKVLWYIGNSKGLEIALFLAGLILLDISYMKEYVPLNENLRFLLTSIGAGLMILLVVSSANHRLTPVEYVFFVIGNNSYAFYLIHHIVLIACRSLISRGAVVYGAAVLLISSVAAVILTQVDDCIHHKLRVKMSWIYSG